MYKNRQQWIKWSSVMMLFFLLVAACAPTTPQAPVQPTAAEKQAVEVEKPAAKSKVALLLPGSISDAGWNANAYKGLQEIEAQGYETAFTESVPVPDIEAGFRSYAEQGFNLIIGHGFEFGEPALKVASDFPDVNFHVSGKAPPNVTIPKNLGFLDQQEFQGAYLSGVTAGLMTKSNKLGYVGGMEIPPQLANLAAFTNGARSVNPKVQILGVLTGTFEDPEKGREAALSQIANGADVIMQTADSTGVGAIQAAKEKKVMLIGYGGDQSEMAPDLFLTSLIVENPKAIALQAQRIKDGTFGGSVWVAGIKEGIINIAPFGKAVPKEVADKVTAMKEDIVSGKLVVPEVYDRIDQTAAAADKDLKVALLLPGSISDAGWNANAYKGLQEIEGQGYKTAYTESVPVPDIEAGFRSYAEQGFNLIIGHGFEFGEPALKVAPDFPDIYFHVSGKAPPNVTIPKNLGFLDQQEYQGAYLSGVTAGLMTKTNKLGYVGGMEIPPQLANLAAFTNGARSVNPNVKILGVLTGTFEDPEKGREAALSQIANGADVIMQTADSTGVGAIQAAKEKGVKLIGYGGDQSEMAPDLFLTSLIVENPKAIALQVQRISDGTFGGSVWVAGIKEGIINIAPFGKAVPKDVADKVMAMKDDIVSGKLVVPEVYDRIDQK